MTFESVGCLKPLGEKVKGDTGDGLIEEVDGFQVLLEELRGRHLVGRAIHSQLLLLDDLHLAHWLI